jgi:hypothetical protein
MRLRLRTLLIVLAAVPPLAAGAWLAFPYLPLLTSVAVMLAIPSGIVLLWLAKL